MKVLEHCCVSDLGPEELVYGQAGAGGHQPAVAEFTLDHVIAVHSVDEQTRIRADLLQHTHTHTHTHTQWSSLSSYRFIRR